MSATYTPNPWLVTYAAQPQAKLNLFCFPYAGGSAQIFRSWRNAFPAASGVQVWAIQYPGRAVRMQEPPLKDYSLMIERMTPALLPLLTTKPFAFFGHSMGAILAFELTRTLRRQHGLAPLRLLVSGRRAPQVEEDEPATYNLPEAEFIERLRELKGTPAEVLEHEELLQLMLPILRADFELVETYRYRSEPPLQCPISVYGGTQDKEVEEAHLTAWCEQTVASCALKMFEGDHFFLQTAQPLLLEAVKRDLLMNS
ncbi:MAG TPA: alpha/beta fold hydrolase [Pyrinomonadaceae bacterium]|nr:alpha/beta fold hydrolase [Pyrinomonadaceae bacterium]